MDDDEDDEDDDEVELGVLKQDPATARLWPAWRRGDRPPRIRDLPASWWTRLAPLQAATAASTTMNGRLAGLLHASPGVRALLMDPSVHAQVNGGVFGVDFAPDGRTMVAACESNMFRVLDGFTGSVVGQRRNAHYAPVNVVTFASPNHFFTSSDDGTVRLWDLRLWQRDPLFTLDGHNSWVKSCEYVAPARMLLSTALDGDLIGWSVPEVAASAASAPPTSYSEPVATASRDADDEDDDSNWTDEDDAEEGEEDEGVGEDEESGSDAEETNGRLAWRLRLPGLLFASVSPDHSRLLLSTKTGITLVVHNLDAPTLAHDLRAQRVPDALAGWAAMRTDLWRPLLYPDAASLAARRNCVEVLDMVVTTAAKDRATIFTTPQFDPLGQRAYTRIVSHTSNNVDDHFGTVYDVVAQPAAAAFRPPETADLMPWTAPRFRGCFNECPGLDNYFKLSCFTPDSRFICSPDDDGFRMFFVDPGFVETHPRRTLPTPPGNTGLRGIIDHHGYDLKPVHRVRGIHLCPLGCSASPVQMTIASYGMDGKVVLSTVQ